MRLITEVDYDVVVAFDISFNEMLCICAFGTGISFFGPGHTYDLVILKDFEDQFYFVMRLTSSYYTMAETVVLHGMYSYAMQELNETN